MDKEYKSIEQKLWQDFKKDFGKAIVEVGENFIKSVYAVNMTPLRIPTFIRKLKNKQTFFQKEADSLEVIFSGIGMGIGSMITANGVIYVTDSTKSGNYLPLGIVLGTNILSLGYELGRKNKEVQKNKKGSLEQNLEIK